MFDKFLIVMLTIISIFTFLITGKLYYDGNVLKIFDFSIIEIKMLYLCIFGILFICFCFYIEKIRNESYNDYVKRKRDNSMAIKINKYKISEYFKNDNITINTNDISEMFVHDNNISITIPFKVLSDNMVNNIIHDKQND